MKDLSSKDGGCMQVVTSTQPSFPKVVLETANSIQALKHGGNVTGVARLQSCKVSDKVTCHFGQEAVEGVVTHVEAYPEEKPRLLRVVVGPTKRSPLVVR